ncbi:MAG TPA: hypothetical protein VIT67_23005 [Povalibacter sp.]
MAAGYYAAGSLEADDVESRNAAAEFGLPLGIAGWLHLGAGTSTTTVATAQIDTTRAAISGGYDGQLVSIEAGYAYRNDSDSFEQSDLRAGTTFHLSRGNVGFDLFHRSAADETISSIERRRRDPLAIRTVESVKGIGYGLHGDVHVNEALRLFASAMTYDYDTDVDGPAFLQRFPRLSLRISGATRDAAYFDNTLRAGVSYDVAGCSLSAQLIRDQLLGTGETANTVELSAWIPAGNYWAFAPWLGQSSSDSEGDIVYGGLRISALW